MSVSSGASARCQWCTVPASVAARSAPFFPTRTCVTRVTGTFSTTNLPAPLTVAYLSNGVNLLGPPAPAPVVPGGVVSTILLPATESALTGVLEKSLNEADSLSMSQASIHTDLRVAPASLVQDYDASPLLPEGACLERVT